MRVRMRIVPVVAEIRAVGRPENFVSGFGSVLSAGFVRVVETLSAYFP